MNRRHLVAATAAALVAGAMPAAAQTYPARPITMIIPFAAGGPTDVVARIVAEAMSKNLGQAIVPIFICGCFFSGIFGFVYRTMARAQFFSGIFGLMLLKNCARAMVWLTGV